MMKLRAIDLYNDFYEHFSLEEFENLLEQNNQQQFIEYLEKENKNWKDCCLKQAKQIEQLKKENRQYEAVIAIALDRVDIARKAFLKHFPLPITEVENIDKVLRVAYDK